MHERIFGMLNHSIIGDGIAYKENLEKVSTFIKQLSNLKKITYHKILFVRATRRVAPTIKYY